MSLYKIPKIISKHSKINDHSKKDIIILDIILNPIESDNTGKKFMDIIRKKVDLYKDRSSTHGYITKIYDIIRIEDNKIVDFGNTSYKVLVSCNIFKLEIGNILIGCKLVKKVDVGFIFEYDNDITIFVQDIINKESYKIGYIYNIEIKEYSLGINKPLYEIIYKYNTGQYIKKSSLNVKYIENPMKELELWTKEKRGDPNTDIISIDYYNNRHIIKFKDLIEIIIRHQIYILGKIHLIYDIPINIRWIELYNGYTDPSFQYNLQYTKIENYPYQSSSMIKLFVDKELYENPRYKKTWDYYMKYIINPYEMLRPNPSFYKDKKNILKFYKKIDKLNVITEYAVSRAYFKVIEIIDMFFKKTKSPKNIFTIADAPGGWAQAFNNLFPKANIITTSLKSGIKYHHSIEKIKNIKIDYLQNKSGNILDMKNIEYILNTYRSKFLIVASDGAIEYPKQYPKEISHIKLFLIECIITLATQKNQGHAFIKIYKRYTPVMYQIIYWISTFYNRSFLYKPKSSRIANSETFLILNSFKGITDDHIKFIIDTIISDLINKDQTSYIISNFINDSFISEKYLNLMDSWNYVISKLEKETHILGYEMISKYGNIVHNKNLYIDSQFNHIFYTF